MRLIISTMNDSVVKMNCALLIREDYGIIVTARYNRNMNCLAYRLWPLITRNDKKFLVCDLLAYKKVYNIITLEKALDMLSIWIAYVECRTSNTDITFDDIDIHMEQWHNEVRYTTTQGGVMAPMKIISNTTQIHKDDDNKWSTTVTVNGITNEVRLKVRD